MTNHAQSKERRHSRRFGSDAHGISAVRIRPRHAAARVVDASAAGALLETTHRLLPGRPVDLHVEAGSHHARVHGRIVRCAVAEVRDEAILYRAAVAFDRHLTWFAGSEGYPVPAAEPRGGSHERASATRGAV